MFDARRVATLYARRRRLTLGLADFDRRAEAYRSALTEVEAELRTMVLFVPPLILRGTPFAVARDILGFLREAQTPLTTQEITLWVMAKRKLPPTDPRMIRLVQKRVRAALNRLAARGVVRSEAESRRVVRWGFAG